MKTIKVLIVEDDKASAYAMRRMLSEEGFEVVGEASAGEEAVTLVIELEPDIVLMDISIEGDLDGVEAANAIKRIADVPIIYLSGYSDNETVERAKRTSPFGYILKPFTKKELDISIQMALYKNEMESQLKENELRLSTLLANIPSAVIQTDINKQVVYLNPVAEVFTQISIEKARGKNLQEIVNLRRLDAGSSPLNLANQFNQNEDRIELTQPAKLVSASGQFRIVETYAASLRDSMGRTTGYILSLRDITLQHQAEQKVRTMASALASLEDGVLISTADTSGELTILYANAGLSAITGLNEADILGKEISTVITLPDPGFLKQVKNAVEAGLAYQAEGVCKRADSIEFTAVWSASPVHNKAGSIHQIVFTIRDVTHLRKLEENMRQSQKIEAVGRLAGGIAHDFNNLLSVINSYSDLQILKLQPDSPAMKYAQQIRMAGKKGADLVSQLMTFSRRDKPAPRSLDLRQVTDEIKGMLSRVIRENISLKTQYAADVKSVMADQGQIEQILINLCVNARDAMTNGGEITIQIQNQSIGEDKARELGFIRAGTFVVISLRDTGCGMDEETQKRVFDPFFTTKEIGKGTGLGLSTVYGIMKQLGGFCTVKSKLGEGSCFDLFFPSAHNEVVADTDESSSVEIPHGTEHIWVVEDDDTFLDCIAGLLTVHGYSVHTAKDGAEAIEKLMLPHEPIQLLITDIVMPNFSGREVASRLLEIHPEAKIIFMTGYDDQLDAFYSFPNDSLILEKPFPLNILLNKVRSILDTELK
jgi:PAS domain S-box-containing protein